jgi:hypothetical protein
MPRPSPQMNFRWFGSFRHLKISQFIGKSIVVFEVSDTELEKWIMSMGLNASSKIHYFFGKFKYRYIG